MDLFQCSERKGLEMGEGRWKNIGSIIKAKNDSSDSIAGHAFSFLSLDAHLKGTEVWGNSS